MWTTFNDRSVYLVVSFCHVDQVGKHLQINIWIGRCGGRAKTLYLFIFSINNTVYYIISLVNVWFMLKHPTKWVVWHQTWHKNMYSAGIQGWWLLTWWTFLEVELLISVSTNTGWFPKGFEMAVMPPVGLTADYPSRYINQVRIQICLKITVISSPT